MEYWFSLPTFSLASILVFVGCFLRHPFFVFVEEGADFVVHDSSTVRDLEMQDPDPTFGGRGARTSEISTSVSEISTCAEISTCSEISTSEISTKNRTQNTQHHKTETVHKTVGRHCLPGSFLGLLLVTPAALGLIGVVIFYEDFDHAIPHMDCVFTAFPCFLLYEFLHGCFSLGDLLADYWLVHRRGGRNVRVVLVHPRRRNGEVSEEMNEMEQDSSKEVGSGGEVGEVGGGGESAGEVREVGVSNFRNLRNAPLLGETRCRTKVEEVTVTSASTEVVSESPSTFRLRLVLILLGFFCNAGAFAFYVLWIYFFQQYGEWLCVFCTFGWFSLLSLQLVLVEVYPFAVEGQGGEGGRVRQL